MKKLLMDFFILGNRSNFALERLKRAPACSRRSLSFKCEVLRTLSAEKAHPVPQNPGDRCWVLGDGCWEGVLFTLTTNL